MYSLAWSVGGRLDIDDRAKWDAYLRTVSNEMPKSDGKGKDVSTIYDYYVDRESITWSRWSAPEWKYPAWQGDNLDFSNLLIPTLDSTRSEFILNHLHNKKYPTLMIGEGGTAKTVTALMFSKNLMPNNES